MTPRDDIRGGARRAVTSARGGLATAAGRMRLDTAWAGWMSLPRKLRTAIVLVGVVVLAVLYPYYRDSLTGIPFFGKYIASVNTLVLMLIFTMMAVGLNVVVGYAGLLDLGYVAFYAIGAYAVAVFSSTQFGGTRDTPRFVHFGSVASDRIPGIHISIWLLLLFAAILTAVLGVLIGLPTLRLRGDYLAIVTLGFGEILPQIARNGNDLGGFDLTGGPSGITPVDPPGFGKTLSNATGGFLPDSFLGHGAATKDKLFLWTALGLLVLTVFCCTRLRDSRLGRAWIAIREDETAAAAMGIPLMRTKTWAYAVGAFFGGLAGGFFASQKSSAFADDFFFNISVFILCMVILGGMGNVWGVIAGALFLSYLNYEGLAKIGADINDKAGTHLNIPRYTFLIFGVILLVVMLFRPEGLFPEARRKAEIKEGVHDEPLYDTTGG